MQNNTNNTILVYSIKVDGANPNGDPRNDNSPRTTNDGRGFMSQYSIKHKIRNRLHDMGENVYMYNDEENLTKKVKNLVEKTNVDKNDGDAIAKLLKETFIDIRLFGSMTQTVKMGKDKGDNNKSKTVSRAVAHPSVTFSDPRSIGIINPYMYGITSCISVVEKNDEHGSSTMGSGSDRVFGATYVGYININRNFCNINGVSDEDINKFISALKTIFVNDDSAARPVGSMKLDRLVSVEYGYDTDPYDIVHGYIECFDENGNMDEISLKNKVVGVNPTILK